jgi:hypothetical protein
MMEVQRRLSGRRLQSFSRWRVVYTPPEATAEDHDASLPSLGCSTGRCTFVIRCKWQRSVSSPEEVTNHGDEGDHSSCGDSAGRPGRRARGLDLDRDRPLRVRSREPSPGQNGDGHQMATERGVAGQPLVHRRRDALKHLTV